MCSGLGHINLVRNVKT